jgi:hypothetical protein
MNARLQAPSSKGCASCPPTAPTYAFPRDSAAESAKASAGVVCATHHARPLNSDKCHVDEDLFLAAHAYMVRLFHPRCSPVK